jgi:peptide/nickel transport system substrate-binding protein
VADASGTAQPDGPTMSGLAVPRAYTLSRRDLLRFSAVGGAAIGVGALLSACGSSSSGGTAPVAGASSAAGTPKRGGTLRIGLSGGDTVDGINPLLPGLPTDYARIPQIFEPLIAWDDNLRPIPYLAESMTSNATATEWTIKVRKGVTFHNGKPLTADDVIFTFQSILDPKAPGYGASPLALVDAKNIKKVDNYTVKIPCTGPFSTFMETLPVYDFSVIPTGFNPKKPIGTGPFTLKSFTPGQQSVMVRNANYWQNNLPYVDELILIDFANETSQTQALASGQVDAINLLSAASIDAVKSAGKQVVISNGGGFSPWSMRIDQAPFNDVRVRQAMRLVLDRQALINVVFGGHGLVGNDVFSYYDAAYDHTLPQRVQDIGQAKSLLKQAGHDGLTVEMVLAPVAQGAVSAAQIYKQQAAQAGITINLRQMTTTAYDNGYTKWPFSDSFWYYNPYFEEAGLSTIASGPFNETHFTNPQYGKLYNQGLAATNPATRTDIAHQMQKIDYDTGGFIIPCFTPLIEGLSTKVHGDKPSKSGLSFNNWDLKSLWMD